MRCLPVHTLQEFGISHPLLLLFTQIWLRLHLQDLIPSLPPVGLAAGTISTWIVWSIWLSRNQLIFQHQKETLTKQKPSQTLENGQDTRPGSDQNCSPPYSDDQHRTKSSSSSPFLCLHRRCLESFY